VAQVCHVALFAKPIAEAGNGERLVKFRYEKG